MNIAPIAHFDVLGVQAGLLSRLKLVEGLGAVRTLALRQDGVKVPDQKPLREWQAMRDLLRKVQAEAKEKVQGIDPAAHFGDVMLERIIRNGIDPWEVDEIDTVFRYHLPLATAPGCWTYSGGESYHIPVGLLCFVNHRVPFSSVNFGLHTWVRLVIEFRRAAEGA